MPLTQSDLLIERARKLAPIVRQRAAETERLRRLPDETVADFIAGDFIKCVAPKRYGGYELDWCIAAKIVQEVASGCGSSGWVLNAYFWTTWLVSLFPESTQEHIFGGKGYVIGPCPLNPRLGQARKVDGGYVISARAAFASGIYHSEWAVTCATVTPDAAAAGSAPQDPQAIYFAVPRSDYEFDMADWAVLGARGTCSATLVMRDIFVPDERVIGEDDVLNGTSPGAALHGVSLYRMPMMPPIALVTTASMVGVAQESVAAFEEYLRKRILAFTGESQLQSVAGQMRLADAAANADGASVILASSLEELTQHVNDGTLSTADRAKYRLRAGFLVALCRHAVDFVKDGSGATALKDGSRIQRTYRDVHMMSGNNGYQLDLVRELYGRVALGFPYRAAEL